MPDIKLIGCDLDGTFFPDHLELHEENAAAVKAAQEQDILVCACTTRNHIAGNRMMKLGGFDDYSVICNGAAIINHHTGEELYNQPIDPDLIIELTKLCEEYDLSCGVFTSQKLVAYMPCFEGGFDKLFEDEAPSDERYIYCEDLDELYEQIKDDGLLFFIISDKPGEEIEIPEGFQKAVRAMEGVHVTTSNPHVVEILADGVSKGNSLSKLAEILGVERQNVMAMGDNHNDVSMIEWAGYGVAMGDAVDACKEAADHVTIPAEDGGVAQAIKDVL